MTADPEPSSPHVLPSIDPDEGVETLCRLVPDLDSDTLVALAAAIADELRERAVAEGDRDAILARAFERGFGRDGLGHQPWIEGPFVVCPGGLVARNRANHRCRFVSVDGSWVWESPELIHEEKRSTPGPKDGFRAVALIPILEGCALDVVSGKMRSGQHATESVTSWEVRAGRLVEVGQRVVAPRAHRDS